MNSGFALECSELGDRHGCYFVRLDSEYLGFGSQGLDFLDFDFLDSACGDDPSSERFPVWRQLGYLVCPCRPQAHSPDCLLSYQVDLHLAW